MTPAQLLVSIAAADNADKVRAVLDQYAAFKGKASYLDLQNYPFGGKEANSHSIHAMQYVGNAAFEKITNMHDAVISFLQDRDWFQTSPATPSDALAEIAARQGEGLPGVYVAIATAHNTDGRAKAEANVSFIDEGIGIRPRDMPDTILSLGESNKLRNPLMCGCYGQGGSAIHGFSPFSLVLSRSADDPSTIGFTIVYQVYPECAKAPSYAYLTNERFDIFEVKVADIDAARLATPRDLDSANPTQMLDLIENRLILPDHGTVVKVWNLQNSPFTGLRTTFDFLRDKGFSLKAPTRLRVGTRTRDEANPEGVGRKRQEVVGLHGILSGTDAKGRGSEKYHNLAHRVARREVLGGGADIHCWIRDHTPEQKAEISAKVRHAMRSGKPIPKRTPVIQNITGIADRVGETIYVTLNGMTHFNLRTRNLLKSAGLENLDPYFFMEIDCDPLDQRTKGMIFTSSREGMKRDYEDRLKREIVAWLRNEASDPNSEISKAHAAISAEMSNARTSSEATREYTDAFFRSLKPKDLGSYLNGLSGPAGPDRGRGEAMAPDGHGDQPGEPPREVADPTDEDRDEPDRVIVDEPTWLKVSKRTIEVDRVDYVHIRTDAGNQWSKHLTFELPPFLVLTNEPELHNGRMSCRVSVEGSVGDKGTIRARLDLSGLGRDDLHAECDISIVRKDPPKKAEAGRAPKAQGSVPEIIFTETNPAEPNWEQVGGVGLDPLQVAMTYQVDQGVINVLWNTEFKPLRGILDDVRKRSGQNACDRLVADCQIHARILTLTHIGSGGEADVEAKRMWAQAIASYAFHQAHDLFSPTRSQRAAAPPEGDLFAS